MKRIGANILTGDWIECRTAHRLAHRGREGYGQSRGNDPVFSLFDCFFDCFFDCLRLFVQWSFLCLFSALTFL